MKQKENLQKTQRTTSFGSIIIMAAFLATNANVLAGPTLTSFGAGPQIPAPVCRGSNATYVVTVSRTGNGNMDVYLSASGLPMGVSASFSPNPVHFSGSAAEATATLTLSTASYTPPGSSPITIRADDGAS